MLNFSLLNSKNNKPEQIVWEKIVTVDFFFSLTFWGIATMEEGR